MKERQIRDFCLPLNWVDTLAGRIVLHAWSVSPTRRECLHTPYRRVECPDSRRSGRRPCIAWTWSTQAANKLWFLEGKKLQIGYNSVQSKKHPYLTTIMKIMTHNVAFSSICNRIMFFLISSNNLDLFSTNFRGISLIILRNLCYRSSST